MSVKDYKKLKNTGKKHLERLGGRNSKRQRSNRRHLPLSMMVRLRGYCEKGKNGTRKVVIKRYSRTTYLQRSYAYKVPYHPHPIQSPNLHTPQPQYLDVRNGRSQEEVLPNCAHARYLLDQQGCNGGDRRSEHSSGSLLFTRCIYEPVRGCREGGLGSG